MRTPSSALPAAPQDLVLGRGRPFDAAALPGFFDFNFTTFLAAVFDLALALALLRFLVIARSPLIPVDARTNRACSLFLANHALRVEVADAAALAAGGRIDRRVDERRLAGIHRRVDGAFEFVRRGGIGADP